MKLKDEVVFRKDEISPFIWNIYIYISHLIYLLLLLMFIIYYLTLLSCIIYVIYGL